MTESPPDENTPEQAPKPAPTPDRTSASTPLQIFIAIGGLVLFVAVAFSVCQSMPSGPTLTP